MNTDPAMHDDTSYQPLEDQLSAEAARMLPDSPSSLPISSLRREFVRRQRRSRAQLICFTAMLLIAGAGTTIWVLRPTAELETPVKVVQETQSHRPVGMPANQPQQEVVSDQQPESSHGNSSEVLGIAILISQPGANGEPELVPGFYVPRHVEEIRADDLSPAVRNAMTQLLGSESEFTEDPKI